MTNEMILSFQTLLRLKKEDEEVLHHCANLLSRVERSLYVEVSKGQNSASCKNIFLKKFQITARQFNACRVSLEGKIASYQSGQERTIVNLSEQIEKLNKQIKLLERKPSKLFALHQKKRRKNILQHRLATIQEDKKQKKVHLCFGGKKLFKAQYYLKNNGFTSHSEWKKTWEANRSSEFFVLGSKDESGGNQTCTATLQSNGKFCLSLRLPPALEKSHGKYMKIEDLVFAYGQETIVAALHRPEGQALSYRFKKDAKSWKVFVSTAIQKVEPVSLEENGVIGIDVNADHIAYVETDRFGNPIAKKTIPWVCYGKTKGELKALTGEICKEIVDKALGTKKPLVIEELNFQKKKLSLQEHQKKIARLLSSLAYGLFFTFLIARAYKKGINVHRFNPAFTLIIGRVNYAKRYGLSVHLAAALCIARRYQKFSEAPCSPTGQIPDGKGSHVTFSLPVRNRKKHVWHFWGQVKKKLKTVLAALYQATCRRSLNST